VFYPSHMPSELRRAKKGRALLTIFGVGLVVTVTALSTGLARAQAKVVKAPTGVGIAMSVTRTTSISSAKSQSCGPGPRLSPSGYSARFAAIAQQKRDAEKKLGLDSTPAAKTATALSSQLKGFSASLTRIGNEFAALRAPCDAEAANRAVAQAQRDQATAIRAMLPRISKAKTVKAAITVFATDKAYVKGERKQDAALKQLRKLGYLKMGR